MSEAASYAPKLDAFEGGPIDRESGEVKMTVVVDCSKMSIPLKNEWEETIERLKKLPNVRVILPPPIPAAKVTMEGVVDCIMHSQTKRITPSLDTPDDKIEDFPKDSDVGYSKLWVVLDGSDPENPWYLEIERPMIPSCEWKGQDIDIHSGDRVRVTMEVLVGEAEIGSG